MYKESHICTVCKDSRACQKWAISGFSTFVTCRNLKWVPVRNIRYECGLLGGYRGANADADADADDASLLEGLGALAGAQ